jgi:hypothetical protein
MILGKKDSSRLLKSHRYANRAGPGGQGRAHSRINLSREGHQPIVKLSGLFSI